MRSTAVIYVAFLHGGDDDSHRLLYVPGTVVIWCQARIQSGFHYCTLSKLYADCDVEMNSSVAYMAICACEVLLLFYLKHYQTHFNLAVPGIELICLSV